MLTCTSSSPGIVFPLALAADFRISRASCFFKAQILSLTRIQSMEDGDDNDDDDEDEDENDNDYE